MFVEYIYRFIEGPEDKIEARVENEHKITRSNVGCRLCEAIAEDNMIEWNKHIMMAYFNRGD